MDDVIQSFFGLIEKLAFFNKQQQGIYCILNNRKSSEVLIMNITKNVAVNIDNKTSITTFLKTLKLEFSTINNGSLIEKNNS